jgi:hypothetical protein
MSAPIPTIEPSTITMGSTVKWTKSLPDYPVGTWTLKYRFRGAADIAAVTATTNGSDFLVTLTAVATALYTAGSYWWYSWVESGSERYDIGSGSFTVKANPATATGTYDGRTQVQLMIAAIEAMLLGVAAREEQEYEISAPGGNGRRLAICPREDLI